MFRRRRLICSLIWYAIESEEEAIVCVYRLNIASCARSINSSIAARLLYFFIFFVPAEDKLDQCM